MRSRASLVLALVLIVLAAPIAAACGGDDSSSSTGPTGGSDRDQAFVTGLCKSFSTFSNDVEKALAGPTPSDLAKAFEMVFTALVGPMQQFSQSFAKLEPPDDLASWHKDASKQLAAAAKALKDGKFDDPSLQGLSRSPIPDMPAGPRDRLSAISAKTSDCKQFDPFAAATNGGGSSGGSGSDVPTKALKDAATGTWTGKFGTLVFNTDGTATFDIKNCGTVTPSSAPFGVVDTCSTDRFAGTLEVGTNSYILREKGGAGSVFGAYVDKDGRLHVGLGDVSAFGPGQKGTITIFAAGTLTVDGTKCTRVPFSGGKDTKQVTCSWKKEQGQDVLEYDNGSGGTEKLVILSAEGLAAEPSTFVSVFDKKK